MPDDHEFDARELELLEHACAITDRIAALEDVVEKRGVMTLGSTRQPIVHPAVAEIRQQQLAQAKLLSALGLDDTTELPAASPASLKGKRAANARWAQRDRFKVLRGGQETL